MKIENYVYFEVEDNGYGLKDEDIDHIFDRFYSKTNRKSLEKRGIGLGLSICKSIIEAHDGEIEAFNNKLGGATFRFKIPCEEECMSLKPQILIVEDEKPIRKFIRVSLETQGYECIEASDGSNAITLVYSMNPDIIILDLGLPDMDGIDVINKIRDVSEAKIIVVLARGHEREKVYALDTGADDYLTKPFSVPELLAKK